MKYISIAAVLCLFLSCDPEKLFKNDTEEEEREAPQVSAISSSAPNLEVNAGSTVEFWVTATNPEEGSLSYTWTAESGSFLGSAADDRVTWVAPAIGKSYWVRVVVSNQYKNTSREISVSVRSTAAPSVTLTEPLPGSFWVQNTLQVIRATVTHDNGISEVGFFVNDSLLGVLPGIGSEIFTFSWNVDAAAGLAEIKVVGTAIVAVPPGADSVRINIEGVVPGKK